VAAPADDGYWNHNVHYQRVILDAVPPGCGPAVDIGCGDGLLVRKLAARCGPVTGIDRNVAMIALARSRPVPDQTWAQVRETARRLLPGVRYRRLLLWRYSLVWDKPGGQFIVGSSG
jgi:SAM-dependent methyltransferase